MARCDLYCMVSIGVVACWTWLGTENWDISWVVCIEGLVEGIQTELALICGASSVGLLSQWKRTSSYSK